MLTINGQEFQKNSKTQVLLHPYNMYYDIPTTVICGAEEGPTLLVTTQIHAGEYNGSRASMEVAKLLDPAQMKGTIILMHCVNTSGFYAKQRRFVPEDRVDLNGNYPGNPKGTVGHRIAAWFVEEIFPKVDFIIDLHGGQDRHLLEPCIFYPKNCTVSAKALEAAKALNISYFMASANDKGHYGYAAHKLDIPAILIEGGYACIQTPAWVAGHVDNIMRTLKYFGMYAYEAAPINVVQHNFKKCGYTMIDQKGVWLPNISLNQKVKKGDLLGTVTDFFGNELKRYYAEGDGIIVYFIAGMLVMDGDEAVAYGMLEDMEILN